MKSEKFLIEFYKEQRASMTARMESIIILLVVGIAFSQNAYLNQNESGFLLAGSYTTADLGSGVAGKIGYSGGGTFDISLLYSQQTQKIEGASDVTSMGISSSLCLLKQSEHNYVSVGVESAYYKQDFDEGDLGDYFYIYGHQKVFGGFVDRKMHYRPKVYLIPSLGFYYSTVNVITEGLGVYSDFKSEIEEKGKMVTLNFSFLFEETGFFIGPGIYLKLADSQQTVESEILGLKVAESQFNFTVGKLFKTANIKLRPLTGKKHD